MRCGGAASCSCSSSSSRTAGRMLSAVTAGRSVPAAPLAGDAAFRGAAFPAADAALGPLLRPTARSRSSASVCRRTSAAVRSPGVALGAARGLATGAGGLSMYGSSLSSSPASNGDEAAAAAAAGMAAGASQGLTVRMGCWAARFGDGGGDGALGGNRSGSSAASSSSSWGASAAGAAALPLPLRDLDARGWQREEIQSPERTKRIQQRPEGCGSLHSVDSRERDSTPR